MILHKIILGFKLTIALGVVINIIGCKKLVDIPEPVNTMTTDVVFSSEAVAISALTDIYNQMINTGGNYSNGFTSICSGLAADELQTSSGDEALLEFYGNRLLSSNQYANGAWRNIYFNIYQANAILEGVSSSISISDPVKNQLIGESKFLRAFCNFLLVNMYGDVPLVATTSWAKTSTMSRTASTEIYNHIIDDLKNAQLLLKSDYDVGGGERIRANKWAATALLARVYLYNSDWVNAEIQASHVIDNNGGLFSLPVNLNEVFLKNSSEAIWQLKVNGEKFPFTPYEGFILNHYLKTRDFTPEEVQEMWYDFVPEFQLSDDLVAAFEPDDQRKLFWCDTTGPLNGASYYTPYKYKERIGMRNDVVHYYMVLRLAEQYLIRAEARTKQLNFSGALADVNVIRARAGLPEVFAQDEIALLQLVAQERRVELFLEWGHRWFDLKRTREADDVLSGMKGADWQASDKLYPIPASEIQRNPALLQNPGYN